MANLVPTITFQVDLTPLTNEYIGPIENKKLVGMLSPDKVNIANAPNLVGGWLPGAQLGNRNVKHGDTIVEYGLKAIYLRNMYGQGYGCPPNRAYLKIISVT